MTYTDGSYMVFGDCICGLTACQCGSVKYFQPDKIYKYPKHTTSPQAPISFELIDEDIELAKQGLSDLRRFWYKRFEEG